MFWTAVLKKSLESSLDCKEIKPANPKGNQSWIFIGGTDAELKLQYLGHLMHRANSLEKILLLGKTEGRRRRGWQRTRWLGIITNISLSNLRGMVRDRDAWCAVVHGAAKSWTQPSDWATATMLWISKTCFSFSFRTLSTIATFYSLLVGAPERV